tara:strand:+ start:424 stop:1017 length:594 start_codon:yes stop_codon:yes gene_type:complete
MFLIRKFYRIKKLREFMNKSVGIATGIGIAIIAGVIIFQLEQTMWQQASVEEYYEKGGKVAHVVYPDNLQVLGPLQINKDKYLLGENIFVSISNLRPMDVGTVLFITPTGIIFEEWGFNGSERESQKKYFKPQLLKSKNICEKEKLIGQWTVMFKGYDEAKIFFEMTPNILPNMEHQFENCGIAYEFDLMKPIVPNP